MKKTLNLLCILVLLLLTSCSSTQPLQDKIASKISCNLFYEYYDISGYKTKNLKIENGVVSNSNEKWERGFKKAIPVDPAEKLAQKLGFKNYTDLQLAYGQLYHYENFPIGKVYTFFGNYNGAHDYTIIIWNNRGVHKIELPDTDYLFRDLQINDNYLYLILSEYSGEDDGLKDNIFIYEIELNGFNFTKYSLSCKKDILFNCNDLLINNKKLYMVSKINITHSNADSTLGVIDLLTNKSSFIKRKGLSAESLFVTEKKVAAIYGKMIDGYTSLPPYLEYYDEKLNIIDSKTLSINDKDYHLYLGDFLSYDGNMYLILKNKKNRGCLFIIHNIAKNKCVYSVEITPPAKGAVMQDATFFINENNEYFTLP